MTYFTGVEVGEETDTFQDFSGEITGVTVGQNQVLRQVQIETGLDAWDVENIITFTLLRIVQRWNSGYWLTRRNKTIDKHRRRGSPLVSTGQTYNTLTKAG